MLTQSLRDLRTIELGKTRVHRLTKVGHPGWGRTVKSSHYETPEQAERVKRRAKDLGYKTVNDYRNALAAKDIFGDLPEVEASDGPAPHLDVASREVAPLSIQVETAAGEPPREEPPLPKGPWQERFWAMVESIVGKLDAWAWLGQGGLPLVEYGQIVELAVPNTFHKEEIQRMQLDTDVLLHCLNELGISKQFVIAVRPTRQEPPKEEPAKKTLPKDPILATIEEEMSAQRALDPRGTNDAVKAKLADLTSRLFFRRRQLKPPRLWVSHEAEWRAASGKRGASGYESTGPATRDDRREAERALRKEPP